MSRLYESVGTSPTPADDRAPDVVVPRGKGSQAILDAQRVDRALEALAWLLDSLPSTPPNTCAA